MNHSTALAVTSKWVTILEEYQKVKAGQSSLFTTVNDLCEAYHVHRKDIRKYYERWVKSGKDRDKAMHREKYFKSGLGREELKKILIGAVPKW